ncbi:MAG: rhodanese-like domain-containing protein [Thermoplasmatota archaeon]
MDVNGIAQVEVTQVADFLARGIPLVDVREQDEWDADHIPGAILRPLSQLHAWQAEFSGQEVLFSCRSGQRSQQVAQHLASTVRGHNLAGGILAYRAFFPEDA